MQETWVQSLVWEYPTCLGVTKPVYHNYWASILKPTHCNYWAHEPQLLKPTCPRACALQEEKLPQWEACAQQLESSPCSAQLEKSRSNENQVKVKVAQSRLTLCDPLLHTVHGILQARILEWVAFPFYRGSSQPRDRTQIFHTAGRFFPSWATKEAQ